MSRERPCFLTPSPEQDDEDDEVLDPLPIFMDGQTSQDSRGEGDMAQLLLRQQSLLSQRAPTDELDSATAAEVAQLDQFPLILAAEESDSSADGPLSKVLSEQLSGDVQEVGNHHKESKALTPAEREVVAALMAVHSGPVAGGGTRMMDCSLDDDALLGAPTDAAVFVSPDTTTTLLSHPAAMKVDDDAVFTSPVKNTYESPQEPSTANLQQGVEEAEKIGRSNNNYNNALNEEEAGATEQQPMTTTDLSPIRTCEPEVGNHQLTKQPDEEDTAVGIFVMPSPPTAIPQQRRPGTQPSPLSPPRNAESGHRKRYRKPQDNFCKSPPAGWESLRSQRSALLPSVSPTTKAMMASPPSPNHSRSTAAACLNPRALFSPPLAARDHQQEQQLNPQPPPLELPLVMRRPNDIFARNIGCYSRASLGLPVRHAFASPYLSSSQSAELAKNIRRTVERRVLRGCSQPQCDSDVVALTDEKDQDPSKKSKHRLEKEEVEHDTGTEKTERDEILRLSQLGVLTNEYVSIIAKVEGDAREVVSCKERTQRAGILRKLRANRDVVRALEEAQSEVRSAEQQRRASIVCVWHEAHVQLAKEMHDAWRAAKAAEEVFPSCPVLAAGSVPFDLDSTLCSSIIVDLRWTGRPEGLALHCLAFSDSGRFINFCPAGESLRCPETGLTIVNSWGDLVFGGSDGHEGQHPGQRACFEMALHNIHAAKCPLKRFAFCVMHGQRTGAPLLDMFRAYLTVRVPVRPQTKSARICTTTPMREAVAVRLPNHVPDAAVAVAVVSVSSSSELTSPLLGIRRHSVLGKCSAQLSLAPAALPFNITVMAHVRGLKQVLSYLRLPLLLEASIFARASTALEGFTAAAAALRRQELSDREQITRKRISGEASIARRSIASQAGACKDAFLSESLVIGDLDDSRRSEGHSAGLSAARAGHKPGGGWRVAAARVATKRASVSAK
jgi:hypothetical protein